MHRAGPAHWTRELIATFGLLFVISCVLNSCPKALPPFAALCIASAYWYTDSTSFANPVVTTAREFSDSFAGIYTGQIAMIIGMQIIAVGMADFVKPAW